MSKGLEALETIRHIHDMECGKDESINKDFDVIEKELKDYQEIREIAKRYNWDDITSKIFSVETDKKYRDLFNSAIVNIQEDYRKARALEIIKENKVNVPSLITLFKSQTSYEDYEQLWDNDIRWQLTKNWDIQFSRKKLTQEEYDLLKEVLL